MDPQKAVAQNEQDNSVLESKMHRRNFLLFGGGLAASAALVSATSCKKNRNDGDAIDLGSGDFGVLNYAYALEQLEAAFYIKVMETPYTSMPALEASYLADIRDHEIAHREFLKNALSSNAIGNLEVNFSNINFSSRDNVLAVAKAFEDLGVAAYNGAGKLLSSPTFLGLAGKIVSVEARHAALIRDLISNGSFADNTVVDANGLDIALDPPAVLQAASAFLKTKVSAKNLPTS